MGTIYLPKDALRLVMEIVGVSKERLSKKSNVPESKIDLILNGMNTQPKPEILAQLSVALGVSVDQLAGNDEIKGAERFIFAEKPKTTADVLKHLMLLMRLTEARLSKESGVSTPIINRLLADEHADASFKTLQKLANFFSLSIDQLTGRTDLNYNALRDTFYGNIPIIELELVPHFLEINSKVIAWNDNIHVFNPGKNDFCIVIEDDSYFPYFDKGEKLIFTPEINDLNDGDIVISHYAGKITICAMNKDTLSSIRNDPEHRNTIPISNDNLAVIAKLYKNIVN